MYLADIYISCFFNRKQLSMKRQNKRGEAAVVMSKSFGDGREELDQALDDEMNKRIIESIQ